MDKFELPRPDWYDSDGRIYKDRLIENFNAIEDKIQQISSLDVLDVSEIDFSSIYLPDVSLDSEDEASIISLKSLIDILGLINYPFNINFDGVKCTSLQYYDSNYTLRVIENKTAPSSDGPIALDISSDSIVTYSPSNANHILLGYVYNKSVIHLESQGYCDINPLEPLSKMPIETRKTQGTGWRYFGYSRLRGPNGWTDRDKYGYGGSKNNSGSGVNSTMSDVGNPSRADNYHTVNDTISSSQYLD